MTLGTIHQYIANTGSNVSEFTHSNWIMLSNFSSPNSNTLVAFELFQTKDFQQDLWANQSPRGLVEPTKACCP